MPSNDSQPAAVACCIPFVDFVPEAPHLMHSIGAVSGIEDPSWNSRLPQTAQVSSAEGSEHLHPNDWALRLGASARVSDRRSLAKGNNHRFVSRKGNNAHVPHNRACEQSPQRYS